MSINSVWIDASGKFAFKYFKYVIKYGATNSIMYVIDCIQISFHLPISWQ